MPDMTCLSQFRAYGVIPDFTPPPILYKRSVFVRCLTIGAMSLTPSTPESPNALNVPPTQEFPRPLRREGAAFFLTVAEQALMDAMDRSSPPPEPILGKRTSRQDTNQDGGDVTEPEEGDSATETARPQESSPNVITAATLRYASRKKLRSEQRDEVETFLQVSSLMYTWPYMISILLRIRLWVVRPSYLYVSYLWRIKSMPFDLPRRPTKYQTS